MISPRVELSATIAAANRARSGVDDQPATQGDVGIAARMVRRIAVFAGRCVELVPAGLLVGEIDLPVDRGQRAAIAAAFDLVADLERSPLGARVVVNEHLETRGLPLDAALPVTEARDEERRDPIRAKALIAVIVAFHRQTGRRLGRQVEFAVAVAETGDADARMDLVCRHGPPSSRRQSSIQQVERDTLEPQ